MAKYELIKYEKDGKIVVITINRPEAFNALSMQTHKELMDAFYSFRDDPALWVAIITGAGDRSFCAGQDIKEFRAEAISADELVYTVPDKIWKPIIAAINGWCLGGGMELALGCDLRIAVENAKFGQPEINIGYMPGGGGTQRLPRFIPRAIASEMLLTGEPLNSQEAYRVGLINRVVPFDKLMATAKQMAETICKKGPLGVRASKEAMIKGYSMPLEEGLELERKLNNSLRFTEDFIEGASAFKEKRPPQYKGK